MALTAKQELFCLAYIETGNASEAYRRSYNCKNSKPSSINVSACKLLADPNVQQRVSALKNRAQTDSIMTRQEALERLTRIGRTSLSDLIEWRTATIGEDEEGDAVRQTGWHIKDSVSQDPKKMELIAELSTGRDGVKIKTHSQLQAIQQLAKMEGWESAAKHEVTGANGGAIETKSTIDISKLSTTALAEIMSAKDASN
ncbi:Terminase small subunit [compost metagenome]